MSGNGGFGNLYRLDLTRAHGTGHYMTLRHLFAELEKGRHHKVPLNEMPETDGQRFRSDSHFGWYFRTRTPLSEGTITKIGGIEGVEAFGECHRYRFGLEISADKSRVPTIEKIMARLGEDGYNPSFFMKPGVDNGGHLDINLETIGPVAEETLHAIRNTGRVAVSELII